MVRCGVVWCGVVWHRTLRVKESQSNKKERGREGVSEVRQQRYPSAQPGNPVGTAGHAELTQTAYQGDTPAMAATLGAKVHTPLTARPTEAADVAAAAAAVGGGHGLQD